MHEELFDAISHGKSTLGSLSTSSKLRPRDLLGLSRAFPKAAPEPHVAHVLSSVSRKQWQIATLRRPSLTMSRSKAAVQTLVSNFSGKTLSTAVKPVLRGCTSMLSPARPGNGLLWRSPLY